MFVLPAYSLTISTFVLCKRLKVIQYTLSSLVYQEVDVEVGHLVDLVPDSFLQAAGELRPGILGGERWPQHLSCRGPEHVLRLGSSILTLMFIDINNIQTRLSLVERAN